jgi:hypothetical protein
VRSRAPRLTDVGAIIGLARSSLSTYSAHWTIRQAIVDELLHGLARPVESVLPVLPGFRIVGWITG